MRRFRILFILVALALLAPLALLIERALHSVAIEREMRHQAVAERVFDEMERALSRVLESEEQRPIEQYAGSIAVPELPFVIGHFQIDAAGMVRSAAVAQPERRNEELEEAVSEYWRSPPAALGAREGASAQMPGTTLELGKSKQAIAEPKAEADIATRGKEVTAFDALRSLNRAASERSDRQRKAAPVDSRDELRAQPAGKDVPAAAPAITGAFADSFRRADDVPSMSGRVIDTNRLLLYRTVAIGSRLERQGLLLDVGRLGTWLRDQASVNDTLLSYAQVSFATPFATAASAPAEGFTYQHRFAEPFDGLTARMTLQPLPGVGSTTYVYALCAVVFASVLLGLTALYRMVSVAFAYAERRSNFVAAVSHELKTPLTAIRMYGEMLRDGMVLNESKRDEYYRHITAESERLSRLINNVLEFARLEKGTRDISLMVGPVEPVLQDLASLVRPHLASQGFTLQVTCPPDTPPVRYERDALMQVLWNLVDNAVKYAGDSAQKEIELRCEPSDGQVVLSVRDHGAGVSTRHLGKIFEPFYRGENELTRRSKGTGLGLALVRGLAERMGATVSGRNVPDGGFEVQVAFRPV